MPTGGTPPRLPSVNSPEASPPELTPGFRATEADPTTAVPAALRDAQKVTVRVGADEAAADAERSRLASEPLPRLSDGDEPILRLLPGEVIHAIRPMAVLEDGRGQFLSGGSLYMTSQRLVHIGEKSRAVDLADIAETGVALERLLLVDLADGSDLAIEVDQPRLLRVQLAAARAAARERAG
jgi:hypothetical protein